MPSRRRSSSSPGRPAPRPRPALRAAALGAVLLRNLAARAAAGLPGPLVKAAAGLTAAGPVPATVAALAQGALPTMSLRKSLVLTLTLLLALGAVGGGTVLLAQ